MVSDWNERMQSFIRTTLGCGCPDEVLQWIDFTRTDLAEEPAVKLSRIDVGGQLLVYVLEGEEDLARLADVLPAIISTGLIERGKREFNRLRVVVATDRPAELQPELERIFSASAAKDDKLHLHVVSTMELPFD
ncbi:MAG: hypothetical protein PVG92_06330 [Holophagae bacterium]|jgi:hypothetical protein